ncbi:anti-sigma factor family protein [Tenggerimyces flavus]|uniref:Anti-sigma factor family protein n=1 Tax=Tenggerimyces flavus TaxID=1708749 RepID=A0ABV7YHR7_9ACTN|nr:zf-HC2 domain-containing protein [Tenggerimyces flavus]MBM7784334.1 negative regulator of sigma E activity [Tenggerimyces flavus]
MTVGSHLSTDVVSDLLEGLLSEPDRVAAETHLASCAECAEVADGLVRVRDVLRSAPPPPMPADIAERLTAVIAVESASRADDTGVVSLGQARERKLSRRGAQILIAAASVAVLAVAGGVVANSINNRGPIAAIKDHTSSPSVAAPAKTLYLARGEAPEFTAANLAAEATKLLTPTKPKPAPDSVQGMANPGKCVAAAVDGELRDFRSISYNGAGAYLAISNPSGDLVRAYVITGCPGEGTVATQADLPH